MELSFACTCKGCVSLLWLLLIVSPLRAEELPAVYEMLPADAQVVLVFDAPARMDAAWGRVGGWMGMEGEVPERVVTDMLRETRGVAEGLDRERAFVEAYTNVFSESSLMFVPITGAEAFAKNFEGEPALGEGVTAVRRAGFDGEPGEVVYVRLVDRYALMSSHRGTLAGYRPGGRTYWAERLGAAGVRAITGGEGGERGDGDGEGAAMPSPASQDRGMWVGYVDVRALEPTLRLGVQFADGWLRSQRMQWERAGADEAWLALHEAASRWGVAAADAAAQNMDVAVLTQRVDERAWTWELVLRPREGGLWAEGLGAWQRTRGDDEAAEPGVEPLAATGGGEAGAAGGTSLLARLPRGPFVIAGSVDADVWCAGVESMAGAWYVPRGRALLGGVVNAVAVFEPGDDDASALRERARKRVRGWDRATLYVEPVKEAGERAQRRTAAESATLKATLLPDSTQLPGLPGVRADAYRVLLDAPPRLTLEGGPLAFVLVGSGVSGYIAEAGGLVIVSTSMNPPLMAEAVRRARGEVGEGDGLLTGDLIEARERVVADKPVAEAYLSLAGLAELADQYGPLLGGARLDAERAAGASHPVALTAAMSNGSLVIRGAVPADSLRYAAAMVRRWQAAAADGGERPVWNVGEEEGPVASGIQPRVADERALRP